MRTGLGRTFAGAIAGIAGAAVLLQLVLSVHLVMGEGRSLLDGIVSTFSYFTVLTNLLVAVVSAVSAFSRREDSFLARSGMLSAVAVYIFVVGLIYELLLRRLWHPQEWQLVADVALHTAVPVLFVAYWFFFVPKGTLRWMQPVVWLLYPMVYVGWTLARGAVTGRYPYPFADAAVLGYPMALVNTGLVLGAFLVAGWVVVILDRVMTWRKPGRGIRVH